MYLFIENENHITIMSRFGKVPNYTACDKACSAKHLRPFLLRDFYNFADQLNKTNFLSRENQTITTELRDDSMKPITENIDFCTNVQYDFEKRTWTDNDALDDSHLAHQFAHQWEEKFDQLWQNKKHSWPKQPYQPEFVAINYRVIKENENLGRFSNWCLWHSAIWLSKRS